MNASDPSLRRQALAAGILALLAVGLAVAERLVVPDAPERGPDIALAHHGIGEIDGVVDTLLAQYHVDRKTAKIWTVKTPDKTPLRRETRVDVPPSFVSLVFNHDLNSALLPLGARVIATEHSREQTVTMHIRKDGVVLRTLVFRTVAGARSAKAARLIGGPPANGAASARGPAARGTGKKQ